MNISYGRFSKILNKTVDRMDFGTDKFHITVNRFSGDPKLQVFIDDLESGESIVDYVLAGELVSFIQENTN